MNRRKIRRYRNQRGNSGVKFLGFVGIMIVAVICGYMTARFVIAPLLGYDTEVLKLDFPSRLTDVFSGDEKDDGEKTQSADAGGDEESNDDNDAGSDSKEEGYALQFGLFTTEDRARELVDKLADEGIDARIKKTDGKFKVISPLLDTKDEALKTLKNTESDHVDDIFITRI